MSDSVAMDVEDAAPPALVKPRIPVRLDGLQLGRAIAALTVIIGHAVDERYRHAESELWQLSARYGVTLFFVISGFIMVRTTGDGRFDPRRFLSRRIRRVVPIYLIVNVIVAVTAIVAPHLFARTIFTVKYFILSILFIPTFDPAGTGGIWPLLRLGWTLNYEMFFYVVFAGFFAFSLYRRAIGLTLFFGVCAVLGQVVDFTQAIPIFYTRIDTLGFVAGAWLGVMSLRGQLRPNPALIAIMAIGSSVILACIVAVYPQIRDVPATQLWLIAVCAAHVALLLLLVDLRGWQVPRALLFVGDASYSMYLFHLFAIGVVIAVSRHLPAWLVAPMIVLAAISGIATGLIAYWLIERPLNRMMRGKRPLTAAQVAEAASTAPGGVRLTTTR
jgi:exopolysaccharide production protein ExoZ